MSRRNAAGGVSPFFADGLTPDLTDGSTDTPTPPVVMRLLEMKGGDLSNSSIRLLLDLYEQWLAAGKPERGKVDAKK